ncbi:MAG: stringent starvation protein A [Legionellales bacterium]|nr:stringent starvation protein A [Legionellales bacterium]
MSALSNRRSVMGLYSGSLDPYCHRVRIVLAEKGVTYDLLDTERPEFAQELAELNPYQTVPTLVDRDLVLYHSEIIMEYLDERFPHPPLMPVYPVARARTRLMMYRVNRDWYQYMHQIKDGTPEVAEKARQGLFESIMSVAPLFEDMPYFMSEEFSLVDCCIAPLFWRLPMLGITLPKEAKVLNEYMDRLFSREAFQVSLTTAERALEVSA